MEGSSRLLVVLSVSALMGAALFVAGFVAHSYLAPPPQQTTNTTVYNNTTVYLNETSALGPFNVTDRRTIIRFDFPAPCASYLESRHTGTPNSIEFWVYVEAGNTHDLEGWGSHRWTEGSASHDEFVFTFDLGAIPGGGPYKFFVAHAGLEWPSTTAWTLFCNKPGRNQRLSPLPARCRHAGVPAGLWSFWFRVSDANLQRVDRVLIRRGQSAKASGPTGIVDRRQGDMIRLFRAVLSGSRR